MIRCADGYIFVSVDLSPLQKLLSKIVANKSFRRTLILDSSITKCLEEDMSGQNVTFYFYGTYKHLKQNLFFISFWLLRKVGF